MEGNGRTQSIACHCHVPLLCMLLGLHPHPALGPPCFLCPRFQQPDGVRVMLSSGVSAMLWGQAGTVPPPHYSPAPALPLPHAALTYLARTHNYNGLVSCFLLFFLSFPFRFFIRMQNVKYRSCNYG